MKDNKNITWLQFNNIFHIVVTFISLTISYGVLMTRVSVLETKMDIVIEQQKQVLAKFHDVETRYGELALKVNSLENKIK